MKYKHLGKIQKHQTNQRPTKYQLGCMEQFTWLCLCNRLFFINCKPHILIENSTWIAQNVFTE